jgi:hypothetical protein
MSLELRPEAGQKTPQRRWRCGGPMRGMLAPRSRPRRSTPAKKDLILLVRRPSTISRAASAHSMPGGLPITSQHGGIDSRMYPASTKKVKMTPVRWPGKNMRKAANSTKRRHCGSSPNGYKFEHLTTYDATNLVRPRGAAAISKVRPTSRTQAGSALNEPLAIRRLRQMRR